MGTSEFQRSNTLRMESAGLPSALFLRSLCSYKGIKSIAFYTLRIIAPCDSWTSTSWGLKVSFIISLMIKLSTVAKWDTFFQHFRLLSLNFLVHHIPLCGHYFGFTTVSLDSRTGIRFQWDNIIQSTKSKLPLHSRRTVVVG